MQVDGKRWLLRGTGLALAVGLLAWALWPRPERADIVEVTRGSLVVTLDEEGETRVRERFVVSAPVAGRLLRIELSTGAEVSAGETVLATFQPRDATPLDSRSRAEAEAEVRALEAELERRKHERDRARADLEFAKLKCARGRSLAAQDVVSAEQLDVAELEERRAVEGLAAAEEAINSASHRLASARARLLHLGEGGLAGGEPVFIRAPVDGVILRKIRESESVVAAGDPILEVGNTRELEIVADYLSRDAVRIRPGALVWIERWGGDGTLEARVRRIDPSGFTKISALGVEEKRVNVVMDLVTPRTERAALADGFRVETRVVVSSCENVVRVPTGALFRRAEQWAVFVVDDGRARIRELQIGERTPSLAEVVEGLEAGERVIAHPSDSIVDGVRVTQRRVP